MKKSQFDGKKNFGGLLNQHSGNNLRRKSENFEIRNQLGLNRFRCFYNGQDHKQVLHQAASL